MTITCLACQQPNKETERNCINCNASLRPAFARHYLNQTEAEINQGRYDAAAKQLAKADTAMLLITPAERERYQLSARAFWLQGCIYYLKGMMTEAEQEFRLAQQGLAQQADSALLAVVLNRLGSTLNYLNRDDEAAPLFVESSAQAVAAGDYATAAKATGNLGILSLISGDMEAANNYYQQALAYAEASGDNSIVAQTYRLLIYLYAVRGPFSRAVQYARRGVELAAQITSLYDRTLMYTDAANTFMHAGDLPEAIVSLRQAHDLARGSDIKVAIEGVALTLAEMHRYPVFANHRELWMQQALDSFSETFTSALSKDYYAMQMAYYYINQEDWAKLHRLSQQLRQFSTAGLSPAAILQVNAAQALIHAALGEWKEASDHFTAVASSSHVSPYEAAAAAEDYAKLLLNRADVDPDPAILAPARAALELATTLYREIGLPHIAARVEELIPS